MTYQEYLGAWENLFGDEDTGDYGYYQRGKRIPYSLHRLTEDEFNQHWESLKQANAAFREALKTGDDPAMGEALKAAFPHELALLV